jgi:iron complex transport system permease protein
MKVTLDLDKLRREKRITQEEYTKLLGFAAAETGSLALNIVLGFGVIATAGGALALLQSAGASIVLGAVLGFAGISISERHPRTWGVLGATLLLVGALLTGGGIIYSTHGGPGGFLVVTALAAVAGVAARSGLLVSVATLCLSAAVGATTSYGHASYTLVIEQPGLTVLLFTLVSWGLYRISLQLEPELQRLAVIASRTSLFLVNFGFWVGSLWGDSLGGRRRWEVGSGDTIPDWAFALAWAVALIATGTWAARENRRWVVNLVAVFGAIHFYTQYFERLGASPGSIIAAGLAAIAIAMTLVRYNRGNLGSPGSPAFSGQS